VSGTSTKSTKCVGPPEFKLAPPYLDTDAQNRPIRGLLYLPVTANSTDERRTDDQGPTAAIGDQALDLLLLS
jgi:hypothetical protein